MAVDMTRAAVSRNEIIRKNGKLEKVTAGTGNRADDVLMATSDDFAVLGNTYDPEWGVQFKSLGDTLRKTYKKEYLSHDAIGNKTEELNDQNMNNYFDQFLQRQQKVNQMQGKGQQQFQDTDNIVAQQAYGGAVPRYGIGGYIGSGAAGIGSMLALTNAFRRGAQGNKMTEDPQIPGSAAAAALLAALSGGLGVGQYMRNHAGISAKELADYIARNPYAAINLPEEEEDSNSSSSSGSGIGRRVSPGFRGVASRDSYSGGENNKADGWFMRKFRGGKDISPEASSDEPAPNNDSEYHSDDGLANGGYAPRFDVGGALGFGIPSAALLGLGGLGTYMGIDGQKKKDQARMMAGLTLGIPALGTGLFMGGKAINEIKDALEDDPRASSGPPEASSDPGSDDPSLTGYSPNRSEDSSSTPIGPRNQTVSPPSPPRLDPRVNPLTEEVVNTTPPPSAAPASVVPAPVGPGRVPMPPPKLVVSTPKELLDVPMPKSESSTVRVPVNAPPAKMYAFPLKGNAVAPKVVFHQDLQRLHHILNMKDTDKVPPSAVRLGIKTPNALKIRILQSELAGLHSRDIDNIKAGKFDSYLQDPTVDGYIFPDYGEDSSSGAGLAYGGSVPRYDFGGAIDPSMLQAAGLGLPPEIIGTGNRINELSNIENMLACGGQVRRYAEGTMDDEQVKPAATPAVNLSDLAGKGKLDSITNELSDIANGVSEGNANTEYALTRKMGLEGVFKGRMNAAMRGEQALDLANALGMMEQHPPGEVQQHLMSAALNPYSALALGAMHQDLPSMMPEEAEANARLQEMYRNASAINSPGARAMAMAEANMQYNNMMMQAQSQHDDMMMKQGDAYAQMAGKLGEDDMGAMNDANKYNAEEMNANELSNWSVKAQQESERIKNLKRRIEGMGSSMGWGEGSETIEAMKGKAKNIVDKIIQKTQERFGHKSEVHTEESSSQGEAQSSPQQEAPQAQPPESRQFTPEEQGQFEDMLNEWYSQSTGPTDKTGQAPTPGAPEVPDAVKPYLQQVEHLRAIHKAGNINANVIMKQLQKQGIPITNEIMQAFSYYPDPKRAGQWVFHKK